VSREEAKNALSTFEVSWGEKYCYIIKQWQSNWDELIAFKDFPIACKK